MLPADTSPEADARYHELLRGMTPRQRFESAARLSSAVRELAVAGIVDRHPGAPADEVRARLTVRLYGREVAERLWDRIPTDAR